VGEGVPRDAARARALFRKACDGGDDHGCREIRRLDGPSRRILSPWTL
jgi:TPR repeat protein